LLQRYLKHAQRAEEFLENNKGYVWDENFNIANAPNDINAIEQAEKLIFQYLKGKIDDETFVARETYEADPSESFSPPVTRSRAKTSTPRSSASAARRLLKRGRADQSDYLQDFDRQTKRTYREHFNE